MSSSFSVSDVERELVRVSRSALTQIVEYGKNRMVFKIPPPEVAWQSCCHMATGKMQSTARHETEGRYENGVLIQSFGLTDANESKAYHWAHEMGCVSTGNIAKRYMQKTMDELEIALNGFGQIFWMSGGETQ